MKIKNILLFILLICFTTFMYAQQEIVVEQNNSVELFKESIVNAAYSSKANLVAVLSPNKTIKIIEIPSLKEKYSDIIIPDIATSLSFSASGKQLAVGTVTGYVYIIDVVAGKISSSYAVHQSQINSVVFQDEGWIFSAGADKIITITDAVNGSVIASLPESSDMVSVLAIPPDAKNCIAGLASGQLDVVSVGSLTVTNSLIDAKSKISAMSFSNDGQLLAVGTIDGGFYIWEVNSAKLRNYFPQNSGVSAVAFDPKLRWSIVSGMNGSLSFYDLASSANIKTFTFNDGYATFISFINDETIFASTSNGFVKNYKVGFEAPDTTKPVLIVESPIAGSKVYASNFEISGLVYDNKLLDNVMINGKQARMIATYNIDTAVVPKGILSAKRFKEIVKLDTVGNNTFEIVVSDKNKNSIQSFVEVQRLSKEQAVEIETPLNNSEIGSVSIPLKFRTWFDIASYSISNNMMDIVKDFTPFNYSIGNVITEDVPMVLGYNQVKLEVTSKDGDYFSKILSLNRVLSATSGLNVGMGGVKKERTTSGPQRWAVIVGVSEYTNPGIPSLKYADKDAEALANFLRTPQGGGYDSEHMLVLLNKDATLANVRNALINFLNQAIDMDLVLIYFAGHGAPEPARPQNIYLLTSDSDPMALGTTAFPMWDIQTVLSRYINAKRVIVFTDACHSGNISVNFATRGVSVTENNLVNQYLADLSKSKEGVVVFTASASGEVSQEFPEMGHGVFTYYLLEGMEGKADYDNDYTVTINELMQYVEEQVKRKTRGAQNPTRSQTSYDKEMTISIIPH